MIAIPAVDLRGGSCVQLVGGSYEAERVRLDDPLGVARNWARYGFQRLHVVDLDAATGRGTNRDLIDELIRESGCAIQVGGGIRERDAAERLLHEGAVRIVVGTRALEDRDWLLEIAEHCPGEIVVAADVRDRRVVTRGWSHTLPMNILDVVEELNDLPLAAILVTAVHREGQMEGTDLFLMEDVAEKSEHPVIASGGVSTIEDLRALADRGIAEAVIGMALYTGALDPWQVAEDFGS